MTQRIGFGDLTDSTLQDNALALLNALKSSGCTDGFDADTQTFQQSYVNAGGSLPNDSNGSSGVDGLYGANTAAALQAVINANPGNSALSNEVAPAGCVAAASGGSGGGGGSTVFSNGSSASSTSTMASIVGAVPGGWWTLGIASLAALGLVYESMKHHPMASAPHRASKGMHHHARRVLKRRGRARRR
jgi:hypothetical protein